jgi:hypothetical protein
MSIRAYKVIRVDMEPECTFNLWSCNPDLLYLLNIGDNLDNGGGGYVSISKEDVEGALKQIEDGEVRDRKALKEDLENILKDFDEGEEYIEYSCF